MTRDEQIAICKALEKACMWGYGGIKLNILDELDKKIQMAPSWRDTASEYSKEAQYEAVGTLKTDEEIQNKLRDGYRLCNPGIGELQVHRPERYGGGLAYYVTGRLADKWARRIRNYTKTIDYPIGRYLDFKEGL